MSKCSIFNWMLFTNFVLCGVVRRYCTVQKLLASLRRRYHRVGLCFLMSNGLPISRDEVFGDVVRCLSRIILRCKPIPSHGITPINMWPTVPNNPMNHAFDFFRRSGLRSSRCHRLLHGGCAMLVLIALSCLSHTRGTLCRGKQNN